MAGLNPSGLGRRRSFEETSSDVQHTERASIESAPVTYHCWTDGTTVYGEPQKDGLPRVENSDIGDFLEELYLELPTVGSKKNAMGAAYFKQYSGEYPGSVDNVPLPAGFQLICEVPTHHRDSDPTNVYPDNPGVKFRSTGTAFVPPNVDSDPVNFARVSDLQLMGPGASTGIGFDFTKNSNYVGWYYFERLNIQDFNQPVVEPQSGLDQPTYYTGCELQAFQGTAKFGPNTNILYSHISPEGTSASVDLHESFMLGGALRGTGESSNGIINLRNRSAMAFVGVRKNGGSTGQGSAITIGSRQAGAANNFIKDGGGGNSFKEAVRVAPNSGGGVVGPNFDYSSSTHSVRLDGSDDTIVFGEFPNGFKRDESFEAVTGAIVNGHYLPENLSGTTGGYVGEARMDDGTNVSTSGPLPCTWTGSAWQPSDGGATFT